MTRKADACPGGIAFAALAGQVVKPQVPSEQLPPPGFVRVQLCISVRAAFEWLEIYDDKARELIEDCRRRGECDHLVHVDPPRGGIRQVLVRRMRGNHALVFMLADAEVAR